MDLNQLNQYVNSTCTVYTDGGEALFPGLIAQCSGTLRINIVYDADTCCPYWTLKPASGIYLRLQDSQDSKKFIMIHGMVINAVNDHFFMLPQDIVFKSNEREYFRQPIQIETTVTIHNGQPVQHACILMDISGGGLCLHTCMEYQVGDLIQIPGQQLYPDGPVHNLDCVVVRKIPRSSIMQPNIYGCRFHNPDDGEQQRLLSDIFSLQCSRVRTH